MGEYEEKWTQPSAAIGTSSDRNAKGLAVAEKYGRVVAVEAVEGKWEGSGARKC